MARRAGGLGRPSPLLMLVEGRQWGIGRDLMLLMLCWLFSSETGSFFERSMLPLVTLVSILACCPASILSGGPAQPCPQQVHAHAEPSPHGGSEALALHWIATGTEAAAPLRIVLMAVPQKLRTQVRIATPGTAGFRAQRLASASCEFGEVASRATRAFRARGRICLRTGAGSASGRCRREPHSCAVRPCSLGRALASHCNTDAANG